ncbi:MAG: hypothetical protein L0219_20765, partial [Phycisphaerales bacterium]|nr:hypothetical protein [Phycisphaerales bacterium]
MAFDDLLADGEADARARVLLARVQPLKNDEDAIEVFRFDANSVVLHGEDPVASAPAFIRRDARFGADMDLWPGGGISKLQCIAEQVLKQLRQLRRIADHVRKHVLRDDCLTFFDGDLEVRQGARENLVA